jgi:hypothetical protein
MSALSGLKSGGGEGLPGEEAPRWGEAQISFWGAFLKNVGMSI